MACNCNKCNPTKDCGCKDTALNNPCTYTDCSIGSERCSDIQCTECVSYCGSSFRIGDPGGRIQIDTGERLDSIIQKFALMLRSAGGATTCTSSDLFHAPYNLYVSNITNSTMILVWDGESSLTSQIDVYYGDPDTVTWVQANTSPIAPGLNTFTITGLAPSTDYKIKITATGVAPATCDTVELLVSTIA